MKKGTVLVALLWLMGNAMAKETLTVAVFPSEATHPEDRPIASSMTGALYALLGKEPKLQLVERERLEEILREQAATLAGLTTEEQGVRVGKLAAAKAVILGKVARLDEGLLFVARAIGTETGRLFVFAEPAERDRIQDAIRRLGERLCTTLVQRGKELIAPPETKPDPIEEVRKALKGKKLPRVTVAVTETLTAAEPIDPAVQTELLYALQRCGFEVLDAEKVRKAAGDRDKWWLEAGKWVDVVIRGEAFLERAAQFGNLWSGRARVELKALDAKTGKVLAVARTTQSAVDITPIAAAKSAAQKATQQLLKEFLTETVAAWGK